MCFALTIHPARWHWRPESDNALDVRRWRWLCVTVEAWRDME